jgi:hypothetical protein
MHSEELKMAKIKIKHPNDKRLEEALERMGKKNNPGKKNKKKEITIPSSHKIIKKDDK